MGVSRMGECQFFEGKNMDTEGEGGRAFGGGHGWLGVGGKVGGKVREFRSCEDKGNRIQRFEIPRSRDIKKESNERKVRGKGKSFDCTLNKMGTNDSFILKSKTKIKDPISEKKQHYDLFKPSYIERLPAPIKVAAYFGTQPPTPKKESSLRVPLVAGAHGLATSKSRMPMGTLDAPRTGEFVNPRNTMLSPGIKRMTGMQHVTTCGDIHDGRKYKV